MGVGLLAAGAPARGAEGASGPEDARSLVKNRKWAEAAIVFKDLLKKEPGQTSIAIELSESLVYAGRREEALGVLSDAISRERGANREILIRRLRVLSRVFVASASFQTYQDGLNLAATRKYRPAREKFERALMDEPANIEILVAIGQCLVLESDFDSAAERLKLARRLNGYEPEVRLWLGRAMAQRGELDEAIGDLKIAAAGLPRSELAPVWLGEALFSIGQRPAAIATLEADVRDHPFHLQSLMTLAQLRIQTVASVAGAAAPVSSRDRQPVMEARKDLQLAQSRLTGYGSAEAGVAPESELSLWIRPAPEDLKTEIDKLFKRVEGRLEELSNKES